MIATDGDVKAASFVASCSCPSTGSGSGSMPVSTEIRFDLVGLGPSPRPAPAARTGPRSRSAGCRRTSPRWTMQCALVAISSSVPVFCLQPPSSIRLGRGRTASRDLGRRRRSTHVRHQPTAVARRLRRPCRRPPERRHTLSVTRRRAEQLPADRNDQSDDQHRSKRPDQRPLTPGRSAAVQRAMHSRSARDGRRSNQYARCVGRPAVRPAWPVRCMTARPGTGTPSGRK